MSSSDLSEGYFPTKAVYPPKVINIGRVHHVHDTNGTYYSRDIGRSSVIGGRVFYQFGDTFCHDNEGTPVIVSNTTAAVEDPQRPFHTNYTSFRPDGVVKPLLELNDQERAREEETKDQEYRARITLWQFGGIVETEPGKGLLWYEKRELYWDKAMEEGKHIGMGIADVYLDEDGSIKAERRHGLIFDADEPLFGNTAAILHEDFMYLMGNSGKRDIVLARVPVEEIGDRDAYRYVLQHCQRLAQECVALIKGVHVSIMFDLCISEVRRCMCRSYSETQHKLISPAAPDSGTDFAMMSTSPT